MKRRRAPAGKSSIAAGASGAVYPLSLCMIVRNEERFLGDALTSVQGVVDEICIVDTGSTDGTVAIAEAFGARVERAVWQDDFSAARNAALAMATGAWIIVLDADECLAPGSRDALRALRTMPPGGSGHWIRCRNYNDSERRIVASSNLIVRIFPNDPDIRYRGALHEFVARVGDEQSLPATLSPIEIVHHGYQPDIVSERNKRQRNLRLSRVALEAAPDDAALVYNYATSALFAGERELAVEQFERVVALTESVERGFRPMALTTLAGLYVELGRAAHALVLADKCVSIAPTLPDGHYARGCALDALGRSAEARGAFEAAIGAGDAGSTFVYFVVDDEIAAWKAQNEIARLLIAEGRFVEAEEWFERGLARSPKQRTLTLNRARLRETRGDHASALLGYKAVFDEYRDEAAAIEYVNYVLRNHPPDIIMAAIEESLPLLGEDYRRAFLASAAAVMLRAHRRADALELVRRALAVGVPSAGHAVVKALAEHYRAPELALLLDECVSSMVTVTPGARRDEG